MSLRGRRHDGGSQNQLIFFYASSASFDPTITTSQSTTITWQPDDAAPTVTTGTTHAFSYVPGAGSHRCKVTVTGGLSLIIGSFDVRSDGITYIKNLKRTRATIGNFFSNPAWILSVDEYPSTITSSAIYLNTQTTLKISDLNRVMTFLDAHGSSISGSISELPTTIQTANLSSCLQTVPDSIGSFVAIRVFTLNSNGWDQAGIGVILNSMYVARSNYPYAAPAMIILTGNAAPSGNYAAPPVDESENSDWAWDAGVGHHWPLTANAKRWYLTHGPDRGTADVFNLWAIS